MVNVENWLRRGLYSAHGSILALSLYTLPSSVSRLHNPNKDNIQLSRGWPPLLPNNRYGEYGRSQCDWSPSSFTAIHELVLFLRTTPAVAGSWDNTEATDSILANIVSRPSTHDNNQTRVVMRQFQSCDSRPLVVIFSFQYDLSPQVTTLIQTIL